MEQYKQSFQISEDLRAVHSPLIIDLKRKKKEETPPGIHEHILFIVLTILSEWKFLSMEFQVPIQYFFLRL